MTSAGEENRCQKGTNATKTFIPTDQDVRIVDSFKENENNTRSANSSDLHADLLDAKASSFRIQVAKSSLNENEKDQGSMNLLENINLA